MLPFIGAVLPWGRIAMVAGAAVAVVCTWLYIQALRAEKATALLQRDMAAASAAAADKALADHMAHAAAAMAAVQRDARQARARAATADAQLAEIFKRKPADDAPAAPVLADTLGWLRRLDGLAPAAANPDSAAGNPGSAAGMPQAGAAGR